MYEEHDALKGTEALNPALTLYAAVCMYVVVCVCEDWWRSVLSVFHTQEVSG